jgi:hypothetical protein
MTAGMKVVEVRDEHSHDQKFVEIEVLCCELEEAQEAARAYLQSRGIHGCPPTWRAGEPDKNGPVYYAYIDSLTFRIRQ